jgi:hypothetical protein
VPLDGADRELQVGGDLGVGARGGEESQDLELAVAQR